MKKYFDAMELYISLKIYANVAPEKGFSKQLEQSRELANAKSDMETQFKILMNTKADRGNRFSSANKNKFKPINHEQKTKSKDRARL